MSSVHSIPKYTELIHFSHFHLFGKIVTIVLLYLLQPLLAFFSLFLLLPALNKIFLLFSVFKAFPNYSANASILGIFLIRCEQCGAVGVREHLVESLKVSSYDWNGQGEDEYLDINDN